MQKQFFRTFTMVSGILTVIVILLLQSFYAPQSGSSKAKAAPTKQEQKSDNVVINTPSDVVASPAVQLDENTPTILKPLTPDETREKSIFPVVKIFESFFRTLFRAIISPNAP